MKELVEFIAKSLVDSPSEVTVTQREEGKNIFVKLHVASSDMGKVIGKKGQNSKSYQNCRKICSTKEW